jgi:hypothetical protein
MLSQNDCMGFTDFDDAVAIGGWPLDEHPSPGFDDSDQRPFISTKLAEVYNIPLRSLYSKDVSNLFMAGRNASCSHVAFTSTRVMGTCAVMGQAAGTAAAFCSRYNVTPRELYRDKPKLKELQQTLLRDDQTIKDLRADDPADLAREAKAKASAAGEGSKPENVLDGFVRDLPRVVEHRWSAPMSPEGAWLELEWSEPKTLKQVQLTFDTGFHRELTLSSSDSYNAKFIRAPQPETIRDYRVVVETPEGKRVEVARVEGNHQRLRRHDFASVAASKLRIEVTATNGAEAARIYEVRAYG